MEENTVFVIETHQGKYDHDAKLQLAGDAISMLKVVISEMEKHDTEEWEYMPEMGEYGRFTFVGHRHHILVEIKPLHQKL